MKKLTFAKHQLYVLDDVCGIVWKLDKDYSIGYFFPMNPDGMLPYLEEMNVNESIPDCRVGIIRK